jgi:hypothetical protein
MRGAEVLPKDLMHVVLRIQGLETLFCMDISREKIKLSEGRQGRKKEKQENNERNKQRKKN